jgi:hypothetical protein
MYEPTSRTSRLGRFCGYTVGVNNAHQAMTATKRLFQLIITRTDRAALPSGAAIGFSTTVFADNLEHAEQQAAQLVARSRDAALLFVERVEDVTP